MMYLWICSAAYLERPRRSVASEMVERECVDLGDGEAALSIEQVSQHCESPQGRGRCSPVVEDLASTSESATLEPMPLSEEWL